MQTVTASPQGTRLGVETILAASLQSYLPFPEPQTLTSSSSLCPSLFLTLPHLPSANLFILLEPSSSLAELGLDVAEQILSTGNSVPCFH